MEHPVEFCQEYNLNSVSKELNIFFRLCIFLFRVFPVCSFYIRQLGFAVKNMLYFCFIFRSRRSSGAQGSSTPQPRILAPGGKRWKFFMKITADFNWISF